MKFEEHEGMLFRMLEEPVPLTEDAKLPCLVRFIQDDSPMGRFNKKSRSFEIRNGIKEIAHHYEYSILYNQNDEILGCTETFEIIGYPVDEGSAEWALYQMMHGKWVWSFDVINIIGEGYVAMGKWESSEVIAFHFVNTDTNYECNSFMTIDEFLSKHRSSGWQIYEPEQPKYKVGDWVECNGNQRLIEVIGRDLGRGNYYHFAHGFGGAYANSITRKLSPSEIIVKIGCLEGKVEDLSYADNGRFFLIGKATERHPVGMYSILYDEMLDTNTRELVKSLLEAMRGDKMRNPCKFCGAKPVKKIAPTVQLMWLQCKNCKSKNMTTMEYNMESATARWNENNPPKESKESTSPSRKKL